MSFKVLILLRIDGSVWIEYASWDGPEIGTTNNNTTIYFSENDSEGVYMLGLLINKSEMFS